MLTLHEHGSSNPLGISSNLDKTAMHPYFIFKDLVTIYMFCLVLAIIVTQYPNLLGHSGLINCKKNVNNIKFLKGFKCSSF
jgi:quinol-cytochrome oxidoreductase complex cytochrome b subunit